ncbi:MAG: HAD-IA family hydrolase [Nitrospiraceae bacterium]|nr:HAD-IA family hydrolase [Nitrospiraceae bacterium]
MPVKLLIFDLDGTLIDTLADITNSINYAFGRHGLKKTLTERQVRGMVGEGIARLMEKAAAAGKVGGGKKLTEELTGDFLAHYRRHLLDNTRVYPGVTETLRKLAGFKKAIITNKRVSLSKKILKGLDLAGQFDLVVGPETAGAGKPSPEPVFYVLRKLKAAPGEAVMIGDSRLDIESGRNAGIKCTVAVTYGYGNNRGSLKGADYVIDSMEDLLATLYRNEPMLDRRADPRI